VSTEIITLASGSPRRKALLEPLYRLVVAPVGIDESPRSGEPAVEYALRMAREKCVGEGAFVLSADTVVHAGSELFNKPRDPAHAVQMLLALSGRTHRVTTAFALNGQAEAVTSTVRFRELTEGEVRGYVATGEPLDKAGAYGIQGIGGFLVASIEGSYSNIVGLPLAEVIAALNRAGAPRPFSETR
jgi:septum formation protein